MITCFWVWSISYIALVFDHLTKDAAIDYLLLPEPVKKLEGQILGLSSQVKDLRDELYQLVQVLK